MIKVDVVDKDDAMYRLACETARDIYQQELRVNLTHFPPSFLSLIDGGKVCGSVGFWRGDEKEKFLTEEYCDIEGVDLENIYSSWGIGSRQEIGEVCCLNVDQAHRKDIFILFSLISEYADSRGVKAGLLTQALPIRRNFDRMGIPTTILCYPEFERCRGVLRNPEEWAEVYFRLKPACTIVKVEESIRSHREKKIAHPGLLPPFETGDKLKKMLEQGGN